MTKKSWNTNLRKANKAKNDEFYTQLSDIEKELWHYTNHFKWKIVFCNCDDPLESNFFRYFSLNFEHLGLKKLITTHYQDKRPSYKLEITRWLDLNNDWKIDFKDTIRTPLKENWDFRSSECIEILKEADIIITNPPFSLFREYVAQLFEYNKKFIIIWNKNAITYKEIFKILKLNKIWLGYTSASEFWDINWNITKKINGLTRWFTNLEIQKRHEDLLLYKSYNESEYIKYDNYDAININKVKDIPIDYKWKMWVPLTYLDKYNPEQFEIIDWLNRYSILDWPTEETRWKYLSQINWKPIYIRIVIKNKKF
jgi:hypothetical protein